MSQENVDIVLHALDSINRGDIDGALEAAADDSKWTGRTRSAP